MIEPGKSIEHLERAVGRRLQLLAVQDLIALSGLVSAGLALIALILLRFGLFDTRIAGGIGTGGRLLLCGIPIAVAGAVLALRHILRKRGRWRSNLETDADQSDLLIDRELELDDRVRTAGAVIRRGGPANIMETALVEDAESRLAGTRPLRFVGYRPPRLDSAVRCYTSVACSIVVALIVLVAMIQYRLAMYSGAGRDGETISVMQAVGDSLEKSTEAIEQSVRPDTPTAALARQQAEVARALKESAIPEGRSPTRPIGRSQALKELSAIEERLGDRKTELENTRASEILSLAERRFQSSLSGTTKLRHDLVAAQHQGTGKTGVDAKTSRVNEPRSPDDQGTDHRGPTGKSTPQDKPAIAENQGPSNTRSSAENQSSAGKEAVADKPADESSSQNKGSIPDNRGASDKPAGAGRSPERSAEFNAGRTGADVSNSDSSPSDRQHERALAENKDQPEAVAPKMESQADSVTGMLPSLSGELMKKAAEMRADKLTPTDVEQFRKAAEGLLKDLSAKDLANLANSKEIQRTLEQLARQVNPQQMEQLARQLLSQKEIRDELQAVGKLLMENRQAKETIAGFADKAREIARQFQQQGYKPQGPPDGFGPPLGMAPQGNDGVGSEPGSGSGGARKSYRGGGKGAEALSSAGRSGESARSAAGSGNKVGSNSGGEPIYARSRPGSAPARVPYSAAYPGYRREAERSVERSQVPPRLRGLIRNYFDAINPDVERHQ